MQGEYIVPGLDEEVTILRDCKGVPHVYADTERDLFFGAGFAQAQDRWAQMDLFRMAFLGRLSELAGEATLEDDFQMRIIGFNRLADRAVKMLSARSIEVLQAYSDGVNAQRRGLPGRRPWEHTILRLEGYTPEPWTPRDTVAVALFANWGLSHNWDLEALRWRLRRDHENGPDLLPIQRDPGPVIVPEGGQEPFHLQRLEAVALDPLSAVTFPYAEIEDRASQRELKAYLGLAGSQPLSHLVKPPASRMASNNWVVSGNKTASGRPILCNDPHLMLSLPSVWMEMHLSGAGFNVIGVTFPGVPVVLIGHNDRIAWGVTDAFADNQDLYVEKVGPGQGPEASYLYDGVEEPFKTKTEVFRYRAGRSLRSESRKILFSRHGPIINPMVEWLDEKAPPLALRWTGYEFTDIMEGYLALNKATRWEEFLGSIKTIFGPVQSLVFASKEGDIGYIANGMVPVRGAGDGTIPVDGSNKAFEWIGAIPQSLLPQVHNPAKGYVLTANNRIVEEGIGLPVSHNFCPGYRAQRIEKLLSEASSLDAEKMAAIQGDVVSEQALRLLPHFLEAYDANPTKEPSVLPAAVDLLRKWDGAMTPESCAATVFEVAMHQVLELTLGDDFPEIFEGPDDPFLMTRSHFTMELDNMIADGELPAWFDDVRTPDTETRESVLVRGLQEACLQLEKAFGPDPAQWSWGKAHLIELEHMLVSQAPLPRPIKSFLSLGKVPIQGNDYTVNNAIYNKDVFPYKVVAGTSMRMIVTLTDPPSGKLVNPPGQAGQRGSVHFSDQFKDWLDVDYHDMLLQEEQVRSGAEGVLILRSEPRKTSG